MIYVQQTCKWSASLNSILTLLVTNCLQATLHRTNQKARSWANCVFKIPGCVRKSFVTFVTGRQVNAWYVGYGNSSKLHVCKVAVIIPNYKIFVVNPLLKQSSNEPVRHDWNKIIVNKILSHHWRVFWRKIIFASKFGGNQMCCTRYTLQYLEQKLLHYR